ncbi:LysR family transcriptional regulator [Jeotgalibacillus proteolyticus]|uniref:LysR family transcriptional regulator n=1 Tax=Jeotgalibacillus proteolyticus TaxID=2082395 RepID=A0A2S5GDP8_9BACL|nr:LysR family transcriptional regulator [Jeotgalibacillus proteolyticus]PPA71034.1 LysR family transcriptional regulator [Jeotgalibacillus proteolyticus]
MEWHQFQYFKTLARIQHVTRAAEILNISQPALSRSIARFEEEIGVPLFEREGRSIRLNHYGEIMLQRVESMMNEFDLGKQEIQDLLEPDHGVVSLGFLHTLSTNLVPDLIASFRTSYPKVHFRLGQGPSHTILKELQSGEYDLCLTMKMDAPIEWEPLWSEELFAILPIDHPLSGQKTITLNEIAEESFIHLKKGYSLRITVERLFEQAGISPRIMFEGDEADTVAGLVAAGLGVSILPSQRGIDHSKLAQIRIEGLQSERTIGLAWMKGRYLSPATQAFRRFIEEYFHNMAE